MSSLFELMPDFLSVLHDLLTEDFLHPLGFCVELPNPFVESLLRH